MLSSRVRLTVALFVCAVFLGTTAQASVIGINFIGNCPANADQVGSNQAGLEAQTHWNDLNYWNDGTNLMASDGGSTSVKATIGATTQGYAGYVAIPAANAGNYLLIRGYLHAGGSVWTVTLTNLTSEYTPGGYDLIVYYDGNNNSADWVTEFALSSGSTTLASVFAKDATDTATWSGTFVQATGTSAATATDGNYVRFTGLTADSLTLTTTPESGDGPINGIQIVAVPEPAALALLSLGLAATLARRRQTQPGRHRRRTQPPGL
ncbi:MAG TPA: PEP-CTERM sorting domain-containing protein [Phycisphaerae bacterium]|nr:PEP-CTERM sorting domain-containing protein [Phycisphaerae bacterium]